MTRQLDVLVMESQRGAAHAAEAALVAAGHRVHHCHDAEDRGFPCVGVTEPHACPMNERIDVALVVRPRVEPRPTPLEDGISCAIRAGVPLVEDGPDLLDPYEPWVAARVAPELDVVAACRQAADDAFDPLRASIFERIARLLTAAEIDPAQVICRIEPRGARLWVELEIAGAVDRRLEQALAVRVLDAVRAAGRATYGEVDVQVTEVG